MHQLTLVVGHGVTVSSHPDYATAHRHLMRHVVTADYYLHAVGTGPARSTYELLTLAEDRRRPHRAGRATIEELAADRIHPEAEPAQSEPAPA